MANVRPRKPRAKPARSIRLCVQPAGASPGAVRITVGKVAADYMLTELAADFGRGFRLEKINPPDNGEPAAYHVHLDRDQRSCECKGYLRHGHCKHADGLAALVEHGKLTTMAPLTPAWPAPPLAPRRTDDAA